MIPQFLKIKESSLLFLICLIYLLSVAIFSPTEISAYEITLGWNPSTEPDIKEFKLYSRIGDPCPPYNKIDTYLVDELASIKMPEVKVTDLEENIKYYFVVTAFDVAGNESRYSNIVYVENDQWGNANCSALDLKSKAGGGGGSGGGCFITSAGWWVLLPKKYLAVLIFLTFGLFSLVISKGKLTK